MSEFLYHGPSAPEQSSRVEFTKQAPSQEAVIERAAAAYLAGNNNRNRATFDRHLAAGKASIKHLVSVARVELAGLNAAPDTRAALAQQIRGIANGGTLRRDGSVTNRGRQV